jgi:Secretion system C-terminal sorting domain
MKNKKLLFNQLLLQYHKNFGKLKRLSEKGLNIRRQNILHKRIEKIKRLLLSIKYSLKKATAVAGAIFAMVANEANAQNFQPPVINPFSLNLASDSISNIQSVDFADLDADGDIDAIIYTRISNKFYFLQNIGSPEFPEYTIPNELSISLPESDYNEYNSLDFLDNICLGDLDFDGDFDMMGGGNNGDFIYFQNIGTNILPEYSDGITNPFLLQYIATNEVDYYTFFLGPHSIEFADLDGDGDLDIHTISEFHIYDSPNCYSCYGTSIYYYKKFYIQNIGDALTPIFAIPSETANNFSGSGDLADLDLDGDFDFITKPYLINVNDEYGYNLSSGIRIYYKENIGTNILQEYANYESNPFGLGTIINENLFSPTIADFDNDNDMDLMFLNPPNEFYYYDNKNCDTSLTNYVSVEEHISLSANQPDAQYQWFQCNYNFFTVIEGATDQSLNIPSSGNYMVQINTGDCTVYSDCFEFVNCTELINLTVTLNDEVFTGYSQSADSYQWLNCNNGYLPVEGETNQNFYPTSTGSYALEITSGTCKDTSTCYEYDICASFSDEVQYYGSSLFASQYNAAYQWIDCNNDSLPIEGETNQIFSPPSSGSYALNVSNDICNFTSDCIEFDICASFSAEVSFTFDTIMALQNNASYQWIDCNNGNLPIEGETNQIFSPPTSGNYAINVSNSNCNLTSDCFEYDVCDNVSTGLSIDNNSITALQDNASYQWYNCDYGNYYVDEQNQNFIPINAGNYSCEIEIGNCLFNADCMYFEICENISTEIAIVGNSLIAPQSDAIYQWITCDQPITFIAGENNQTFTPNSYGSYAVLIEYYNCYIATECFDFTISGINNNYKSDQFSIVPNPTTGKLNVVSDKPLQNATLQLKSITGQIVFEQMNVSGSNVDFDISNYTNGLYFLEVTENGIVTRLKIIKNS